jgi:hypothetical protein
MTNDENKILIDIEENERELAALAERYADERGEIDQARRELLLRARARGITPKAVAEALNAARAAEVLPRYAPQRVGKMMLDAERDASAEIDNMAFQLTRDPAWEPG